LHVSHMTQLPFAGILSWNTSRRDGHLPRRPPCRDTRRLVRAIYPRTTASSKGGSRRCAANFGRFNHRFGSEHPDARRIEVLGATSQSAFNAVRIQSRVPRAHRQKQLVCRNALHNGQERRELLGIALNVAQRHLLASSTRGSKSSTSCCSRITISTSSS
jgi:hypothetical protein